jgi:deoxyhypusine synthase
MESCASSAVLVKSEAMPEGSTSVKGYDFDDGVDFDRLLDSYKDFGFQATNFGLAVNQINMMVRRCFPRTPLSSVHSYMLHNHLNRKFLQKITLN